MKKEEIVLKIKEIISENYDIDIDDLEENELLNEKHGLDSLDRLQIACDVEKEFFFPYFEINEDCSTISEFAEQVLKFVPQNQ